MKEYIIRVNESKKDISGGMPLMEKAKELVRCKDCKNADISDSGLIKCSGFFRCADWFCADGEAKE